MLNKRFLTTLILISSLSGCGLYDRFIKSDECEDGSCDTPALLDNTNTQQEWFCYGEQEGGNWDCGNERDAMKISKIMPKQTQSESSNVRIGDPVETTLTETVEPPVVKSAATSAAKNMNAAILEQPADHYAVQLIAMKDEARVLAYAGLNGILEPLYARIRSQDTDWYVLILGTYPDKASAEAAMEAWSTAKTLKVKPWIRQLGPLQDAISNLPG